MLLRSCLLSEKTAGNPQSSCCWRTSNFAYTPHFWYLSCKNCRFSSRAFGHPWWHLFITSWRYLPTRLTIQLPHDAQTFVPFHSSSVKDLFDLKAMHIFSASEANSYCSHVYNSNFYRRFDEMLCHLAEGKSSSDKARRLLNADAPIPVYLFVWRNRNLHCRE